MRDPRDCAVVGCGQPMMFPRFGLCHNHYANWRKGHKLILCDGASSLPDLPNCSIPGCKRNASTRGMCAAHYERSLKGAPMDTPIMRRRNTVYPEG